MDTEPINAADFGFSENNPDNTVALQAAIDEASRRGLALEIPGGVYVMNGAEFRSGPGFGGFTGGPNAVVEGIRVKCSANV